MKSYLPLVIQLGLIIFTTTSSAGPFEGPLVIKNGYPLYAAIGSPSLISAEPENALDINFSYSSTYRIKRLNDWYFGIDLETAITEIQLSRLVGKGTEIGIDIPVIRYGPGFMDSAIDTYHDLLEMHNAYSRNDRPRNQFLLQITHNGEIVIQGKPGDTALGDVMVKIKQALYDDRASTIISMQAFMNIPTGEAEYAFGSGRINGGLAVLINKVARSDIMLYMNAGIGLIDSLKAMQEINLSNYYFGGAGLEWLYSRALSLSAQIVVQSSPFPNTGIYFIDYPPVLGSIGGRYRIDALSSIGMVMTEDLDASGAPDSMIGADYRYQF